MPGKLIVFILFLIFIGTFVGFNIENKSDVRIWIGEKGLLKEVPILLSFFVIYIFGLISAFPFIIASRIKKAAKEMQRKKSVMNDNKVMNESVRVLGSKSMKDEEVSSEQEE